MTMAFIYTTETVSAQSAYQNRPENLAEIDYPTEDEIAWEISNLQKIEKTQ
jgi:hypothetical protein